MNKYLFLSLLCLFQYCSPFQTYYRYSFLESKSQYIKSVLITPLNTFIGIPNDISNKTDKFNSQLFAYLKNHGFEIKKDSTLNLQWRIKKLESKGFYDPNNGNMDQIKYYQYLLDFIKNICIINQVDAVIIPDIVARESVLAGDHSYWDGVSRKIEIGDNFVDPDRYNFSGNSLSLSLKIEIINKNGDQVFQSFGGIENHLRVSLKYDNKMEVKDNLLFNDKFNNEAIKIAFYPFIKTDIYPKNPKFKD